DHRCHDKKCNRVPASQSRSRSTLFSHHTPLRFESTIYPRSSPLRLDALRRRLVVGPESQLCNGIRTLLRPFILLVPSVPKLRSHAVIKDMSYFASRIGQWYRYQPCTLVTPLPLMGFGEAPFR